MSQPQGRSKKYLIKMDMFLEDIFTITNFDKWLLEACQRHLTDLARAGRYIWIRD